MSDSAQPVVSANVFIVNDAGVLLSFAITDQYGSFRIKLSETLMQQPLWIEATGMGYKKERIKFDPKKQEYKFRLTRDPVFLEGVTVTSRPKLQQMGDTLRYIVSSFAEKEDRSIGDVLRRMPGIKIMDDGTIYYNDKQIENLYIQGDDLMSGKYGTATKVIRKEMIKSVDVIQNHQPIKVLKDKVFSDKTSVNLVLADENSIKISSGGSIGLGLPGLYDISANTILLNKKIKSINLAAINNTGNDYRNQLKSQGSGNMGGSIDKDFPELTLSLSSAPVPNIAQQYYFDNQSRIFNFNNLYNLKNGIQLKANVQVFDDRNLFLYNGNTKNFINGDTVIYQDHESVRNRPKAFSGSFQVFANKEKFYFNNVTQYRSWVETNAAGMQFNSNSFSQELRNRRYELSNDLHWMPTIKSNAVFELRWLLKKADYDKQLALYDGFVSSIKGHEGVYDSIIQKLKDPVFMSHVYLSAKRSWRWGTVYQNAGWITENHLVQSALAFLKNGNLTPYSGDNGNHQRWRNNQYYVSSGFDFKTNRWSGTVQLPLILQQLRDVQEYYGFNSALNKVRFNPKASLRHQISLEKQVSLNYSYTTTFGDFTDTYIGSILKNYRNVSSSQGVIPFNKIHSSSLSYGYQKSISLFFFNADVSYSHITGNTLMASAITDSIEQTALVQGNNVQERWSANTGVSKFIFAIKLNTSLKLGYSFSRNNVILNNQPVSVHNNVLSASVQFSKRFSDKISVEYGGRYEQVKVTSSGNAAAQKVQNLNQTIKASFIPDKKLLVDFVIRNAIQKNNFITQDYFFSDAKIRYTFSKKKFDLNIEAYNLFNVKDYVYFNADSYRLLSNHYYLRGRMIMAKVDVYF
ncbi:TonB-dependent receptor [Sediminibacterium ginsengisoli]|uniref:TonB-dependent receptor n=1 Tax=Sediminibacterium ginsengisoli TaxID=413434 RepID=UPI0011173C44|nr:TonB-dependent receptor [Sediminibacterium ginsengisoli]